MSDDAPEEVQEPRGEEGRYAATWQNKAAGRGLRVARQAAKQSEFAATLSQELGTTISTTALSGYETGRRQVPAAVLMAAAMAAKQSLDALMAESGAPDAVQWAEGLGLPQRLESQAAEIRELKAEVAALRQQYADFQTQVIDRLGRAGVAWSSRSDRQSGRPGQDAGRRESAG